MSEFTKIREINQTDWKTILKKFGEVSINFFSPLRIFYFIISPPKQDLGPKIQTNQGFPPCSAKPTNYSVSDSHATYQTPHYSSLMGGGTLF